MNTSLGLGLLPGALPHPHRMTPVIRADEQLEAARAAYATAVDLQVDALRRQLKISFRVFYFVHPDGNPRYDVEGDFLTEYPEIQEFLDNIKGMDLMEVLLEHPHSLQNFILWEKPT